MNQRDSPWEGHDPVEASEQHAKDRARLTGEALATLRALALAADDADPIALAELAGTSADRLRVLLHLQSSDGRSVGTDLAVADHRCHLHDTTLQVLEYIAGGGYGLCEDVPTIREVAGRGARDLEQWIEGPEGPCDLRRLLDQVVHDAGALGGPSPYMVVDPVLPDLPDDVASAVAGAVREALTNARKHAGASEVRLVAKHSGDDLVIVVSDDGRGFNGAVPNPRGMGVSGSIIARLQRVGGHGEVRSDERGTHVRISVGTPA